MDPRTWVDQLFTYGPYAVLALFVLWVAPAQLKAFLQGPRGNAMQQAVSGFVAVGCWLIVFAMVYYIYLFWPPRTVYLGSLGIHKADAQFFPQTPELFLSSRPVGGDRLRWDYVVVTDTRGLAAGGSFDFAYQWGPNPQDHADFSLPVSLLQKRRIDLRAEPDHPDVLLYNDDGDPATPAKTLPRVADVQVPVPQIAQARVIAAAHISAAHVSAAHVSAAHAEASPSIDTTVLIQWLASSNANLRAQARAQLRQLSPDQLRQLDQTAGLPGVAREQIDAELKGRK